MSLWKTRGGGGLNRLLRKNRLESGTTSGVYTPVRFIFPLWKVTPAPSLLRVIPRFYPLRYFSLSPPVFPLLLVSPPSPKHLPFATASSLSFIFTSSKFILSYFFFFLSSHSLDLQSLKANSGNLFTLSRDHYILFGSYQSTSETHLTWIATQPNSVSNTRHSIFDLF